MVVVVVGGTDVVVEAGGADVVVGGAEVVVLPEQTLAAGQPWQSHIPPLGPPGTGFTQ